MLLRGTACSSVMTMQMTMSVPKGIVLDPICFLLYRSMILTEIMAMSSKTFADIAIAT